MPCLLFLQLLLVPSYVHAKSRVTSIIVFGDSSVDTGNNNQISTVAKSDFKPYGRDFDGGHPTGRFCNGRVATDFISEAFGLKPAIPAYLDPAYNMSDFVNGVCFASAATGYDNATSDVLVSLFNMFYGIAHLVSILSDLVGSTFSKLKNSYSFGQPSI